MTDGLNRLPPLGEDAVLSYSGVVKLWECDRNNHWNLQFYVRAFQTASEILATAITGANPGGASARMRHYRFHSELFCPQPMRIRSSRVEGGPFHAAVIHWMESVPDFRLCATAIEFPSYRVEGLPRRAAEDLTQALPRGLGGGAHPWHSYQTAGLQRAELGMVSPADADHTAELNTHEIVSRVAAASHHLLGTIGFTADWIDQTNCNRMAVEMKITRHGSVSPGESLSAVSWLVAQPGKKTFSTLHQILNAATGRPCATVEQVMLMMDLERRVPVPLPNFILTAGQEAERILGQTTLGAGSANGTE